MFSSAPVIEGRSCWWWLGRGYRFSESLGQILKRSLLLFLLSHATLSHGFYFSKTSCPACCKSVVFFSPLLRTLTGGKHLRVPAAPPLRTCSVYCPCLGFQGRSEESPRRASHGGSFRRWGGFSCCGILLPAKAVGKHSQRGNAWLVCSDSLVRVKPGAVSLKARLWLVLALLQGGLSQPSFLCSFPKPVHCWAKPCNKGLIFPVLEGESSVSWIAETRDWNCSCAVRSKGV